MHIHLLHGFDWLYRMHHLVFIAAGLLLLCHPFRSDSQADMREQRPAIQDCSHKLRAEGPQRSVEGLGFVLHLEYCKTLSCFSEVSYDNQFRAVPADIQQSLTKPDESCAFIVITTAVHTAPP